MSPTIEWEVLVVDNNSNDQTREVAESFCQHYPGRFRYLFEPRQGKSFALNSGIRESKGEILAFVDDDVTVQPTWLQNLIDPFHDTQWAGCGGRILPEPGFSPPPWLALEGPHSLLGALCAYFDLGDVPGSLAKPPVGTNMAFRREMFAKYGGFREDLGPRPGNELRSEDTEFGRRLLTRGERLCYVPSAVVYHEIRQDRLNKKFFLNWWFDFGRGMVREQEANLTASEALKILARIFITAVDGLFSFAPQKRFYCKGRVWFSAGKLGETMQRASQSSRKAKRQAEGVGS